MEYNNSISKTIEYIEKNLTNKLSINDVVHQAFFSRHHYQRIFSTLVGAPIMEYVKYRRLSMAGKELCETNAPIIDIALKYGYESHEGFTRAFRMFHGITPAQCRKYGLFNVYNKMQLLWEEQIMLNTTNLLNISDLLLENTSCRLIDDTNKICQLLSDFSNHATAAANSVLELETQLNLSSGLYRHIATTTLELAKKSEYHLAHYRNNSFGIAERSRYVILPDFAGQFFGILQTIDEINWMLHIVSFNLYLNIEKMPRQTKDKFSSVISDYHALTFELSCGYVHIVSLIKNFWELVLLDIQGEIDHKHEIINNRYLEISKRTKAVMALFQDEVDKFAQTGGFNVIASELKYISFALEEGKEYEDSLTSCALKIDILLLSSSFEACEIPEKAGLHSAIKQMNTLQSELRNADIAITDLRAEIRQLEELLHSVNAKDFSDFECPPESLIFHASILFYFTKIECAKIQHSKNPPSNIVEQVGSATLNLHKVLADDAVEGCLVKINLEEVLKQFSLISSCLTGYASSLKNEGDSIKYIATEYAFFYNKLLDFFSHDKGK